MACDLISAYREADAFANAESAAEVSHRLRTSILAWGGGRSARESFREFRGRDPDVRPFCAFYAPNSSPKLDENRSKVDDSRTVEKVTPPKVETVVDGGTVNV